MGWFWEQSVEMFRDELLDTTQKMTLRLKLKGDLEIPEKK